MKDIRKDSLHIVSIVAICIFVFMGFGSMATTPINMSDKYQSMVQQQTGNERIIDTVTVNGISSKCYEGNHSVPSQRMGGSYNVSEKRGAERHRHEVIIDQLLSEAQRRYPSETISIRNASIGGNRHANARSEQYTERVASGTNSAGKTTYREVTRTKPVWDCYLFYTAYVITRQPMPAPVTHSENFTKPGSTRNDIYRWTRNWLDDNTQRRRIRILSEDMGRGRITGTVTCAAITDQTYIVTSNFIIDVYDARVEFKFSDTILQRTDPSQQRVGSSEQIFLQSIADAAQAELIDFSTSLRSYIQSR